MAQSDGLGNGADGRGAAGVLGVTVRRDRWGIAHVEAPSADAAFAAQGWVAADDRIWQMEWDRRRALGRWAEVVGMAGAREDAFFRRLGLAAIARADYAALDGRTQAMCEAYARGVNRWLSTHEDALPVEFEHHRASPERWEPWHCVAVYKLRHIFMGTLTRKLWRGRIMAQAGPEAVMATVGDIESDTAMVPGDGPRPDLLADAASVLDACAADMAALAAAMDSDGASNSWALSGERTASGKPLLSGDPHRGIEFPNVYHQCHLRCDEFDAIGMGFPGVPGLPHFGHNAEVAWGITHGMCDDTDVFVERFEPGSKLGEPWRTEELQIRGEGTVEVLCGSTPRGPVVLGDPADGVALSMQWTGMFGPDTTLDALWPMLVAESTAELVEAVRPWVLPVNNLLAADRAGSIAFKIRGRVIERQPASRWTPVPGTDEFAWDGLEPVPFEDLPEWADPERGFLVTANNRTADGGPYISMDFAGPSRHDRICELLAPMSGATVADMSAVHGDVTSLVAANVLGLIIEYAVECGHELSHTLLDMLADWGPAHDRRFGPGNDLCRRQAAADRGDHRASRHCRGPTRRGGMAACGRGQPDGGGRRHPHALRAQPRRGPGARQPHRPAHGRERLCRRDRRRADPAARRRSAGVDMGEGASDGLAAPARLSAPPRRATCTRRSTAAPATGDTVRQGGTAPETGERAIHGSVARYAFDLGDWGQFRLGRSPRRIGCAQQRPRSRPAPSLAELRAASDGVQPPISGLGHHP